MGGGLSVCVAEDNARRGIVKKKEMIVKKKSRVSKFGIFKIYIFLMEVNKK